MRIAIYNHRGQELGQLWSQDGEVHCTDGVRFLLKAPYEIREPGSGKVLRAKDGDRLLRVLPIMFSGSVLRAAFIPDRKE